MNHLFKSMIIITTVVLFAFSLPVIGSTQKHPEHPKTQKEHPKEHPHKKTKKLTKETLAAAIQDYVKKESKESGYFVVQDEKARKTLHLKLEKVHKERLATIGEHTYFACADFKEQGGVVYDLDIFMKDKEDGTLHFKTIMVHKENGNPRYTWYEEGGIWKTKKVE